MLLGTNPSNGLTGGAGGGVGAGAGAGAGCKTSRIGSGATATGAGAVKVSFTGLLASQFAKSCRYCSWASLYRGPPPGSFLAGLTVGFCGSLSNQSI